MTMAVIDRFEGENAVLLVGKNEQQVLFPTSELPKNLNEGDYLRMNISFDAEATKNALNESASLLNKIRGYRP